jgi:hypothetical protein
VPRVHFFHHGDPPSTCEFPITPIKLFSVAPLLLLL